LATLNFEPFPVHVKSMQMAHKNQCLLSTRWRRKAQQIIQDIRLENGRQNEVGSYPTRQFPGTQAPKEKQLNNNNKSK